MSFGTLVVSIVLILMMPIEGHTKGLGAAVIGVLHAVAAAWWVFLGGWPCSAG